ncbi:MAG: DUF1328 domain-containing protein [Pseudomonadota bacterium]
MLSWALFFLVAAVIAAVLGFGGIASTFGSIAQILFVLFAIVFVGMLVMHLMRGSSRALR